MKITDIDHQHCWHIYMGPIWMVIPDGQVLQKCCQCESRRLLHRDHITYKSFRQQLIKFN